MGRATKAEITEAYYQEVHTSVLLEERIAELELSLEDASWLKLSLSGDRDFSRDGLAKIIRLSRLMTLRNPLLNHAAEVTSHYVFGQGVSLGYEDDDLNAVLQAFWDDGKNRAELTDCNALLAKEVEIETTGNLLFTIL